MSEAITWEQTIASNRFAIKKKIVFVKHPNVHIKKSFQVSPEKGTIILERNILNLFHF